MSLKMELDNDTKGYTINSYNEGVVVINDIPYENSLIISSSKLVANWPVNSISDINDVTLKPLIDLSPEIIIIGTGQNLKFPPPAALKSIINNGIGYEIMDTQAACRSYTILNSEYRRVVAGLIIDQP